MTFAHPQLLWLLLLVPAVAWLVGRTGRRAALVYSSLQLLPTGLRPARSAPGSWLAHLRWLALALALVALAQPRRTHTETSISASGVDIMVALDMSGSMEAMDFNLRGRDVNRLDMAREVLREFIKKRPSDRIGIVAFAGRPYVAAPLTLDHDFLLQNLERLQLGAVREYNSTAIGSALATAVNRLEHVPAKSRLVILMTDGQNNAGKVPPLAAAEAARALGIKVYTIGIGRQGQSYVLRQFMGRLIREPVLVDIDEETLQKIAELTGGKYYRADNTERFRQIYEEIDRLEKTEVVIKKFSQHTELAHWLLLGAVGLLVLEMVLSQTWLRQLP
ncbi:MAG: VWA domain-containing protein [Verrucomicrobiae bacterium]|nr:VWA domain-containing protein [Verrucomicrobiae bacterium]